MDLTHEFTVPAPPDTVWDTFMDLERVGGCFPGATVTDASGEEFAGSVKVKLGPIALVYNGSGRFVERDVDARRAVIEARGKDKRGNGTASALVTIQLEEEGSGTRATVVTDLSITGKPAQFGRGVIQDVSDKLLARFVACIEQQLGGAADDAAAVSPAAAADAPVAADETPTGAPRPGTITPRTEPVTPPRAARQQADDSLDLGGAALPVLARLAAPYVGGLAALVGGGALFRWLRRRRRCREG